MSTQPDEEGKAEEEKTKGKRSQAIPYHAIVDLYHEMLPELPRVKVVNEARRRAMRARWNGMLSDLDCWRSYFCDVRRSKFLLGQVDGTMGRPAFLANLDFLLRDSSVVKTYEGYYRR